MDPLTAAREALADVEELVPAGHVAALPAHHLRAALARVDELEAMANGGYHALLDDCDQKLSLALQAVEIGATPGPAWCESVRHIRQVIKEVTR